MSVPLSSDWYDSSWHLVIVQTSNFSFTELYTYLGRPKCYKFDGWFRRRTYLVVYNAFRTVKIYNSNLCIRFHVRHVGHSILIHGSTQITVQYQYDFHHHIKHPQPRSMKWDCCRCCWHSFHRCPLSVSEVKCNNLVKYKTKAFFFASWRFFKYPSCLPVDQFHPL